MFYTIKSKGFGVRIEENKILVEQPFQMHELGYNPLTFLNLIFSTTLIMIAIPTLRGC